MEREFEYCRWCGKLLPVGYLSNRGICRTCGQKAMLAAVSQMKAKFGPVYEKWRRNYIAAMNGVVARLLEEQADDEGYTLSS